MSKSFDKLLDIVAKLRSPEGCPWDRKQNLYSMTDDFLEEAYELVAAIKNDDKENICEELGDVLLHVAMHSQIAAENDIFNIDEVAEGICEKLIRRHPHVFGDIKIDDADEVLKKWNSIKEQEKAGAPKHTLDKANKPAAAMLRASKLKKAAAKVGFDWDGPDGVFEKLDEEIQELKSAYKVNDKENIREELGDMFFVLVNLANHLGVNPEEALNEANDKFVKRFNYMEDELASTGKNIADATLQEMDALWNQAKAVFKKSRSKHLTKVFRR